MASLGTRKSNRRSRKHTCRSPSPRKSRPRYSTPEPCTARQSEPTGYISGLKSRERVDKILADMFHHHRWSIKDFIRHMVTEPPRQKYAITETTRASHLSAAIFEQPIVVEQLSSVSSAIYTTGTSDLVSRIQSELRGLINGDMLGEFQSKVDPGDMDIPGLATQVQNKAPQLWKLLVNIMTPPGNHRDTPKVYQGSIVMICSILASAFAPRKSNNFPMLIGLYLHAMGVKRRVISFLAGLGINSAYQTIMDRRKELADLGQVLYSQLLENNLF